MDGLWIALIIAAVIAAFVLIGAVNGWRKRDHPHSGHERMAEKHKRS